MSESWNEKIIAEFRDNDGHVGGNFGLLARSCGWWVGVSGRR